MWSEWDREVGLTTPALEVLTVLPGAQVGMSGGVETSRRWKNKQGTGRVRGPTD